MTLRMDIVHAILIITSIGVMTDVTLNYPNNNEHQHGVGVS